MEAVSDYEMKWPTISVGAARDSAACGSHAMHVKTDS